MQFVGLTLTIWLKTVTLKLGTSALVLKPVAHQIPGSFQDLGVQLFVLEALIILRAYLARGPCVEGLAGLIVLGVSKSNAFLSRSCEAEFS